MLHEYTRAFLRRLAGRVAPWPATTRYRIPCRSSWITCRAVTTSRRRPISPPASPVKSTTNTTTASAHPGAHPETTEPGPAACAGRTAAAGRRATGYRSLFAGRGILEHYLNGPHRRRPGSKQEYPMSTRSKLWLFPALLYAAFVFWYTDFGGPLSDEEVDQFMASMTANGATREVIAFTREVRAQDSGRQFLMVNNIDMNENPARRRRRAPGESALRPHGALHGAHDTRATVSAPATRSSWASRLLGHGPGGHRGCEQWTEAALFRYRSRRAFMEIVSNPAFTGKHHFKTGGTGQDHRLSD